MYAQRAGLFGICTAIFATILIVIIIVFEEYIDKVLLIICRGNEKIEKLMSYIMLAAVIIISAYLAAIVEQPLRDFWETITGFDIWS